MALWLQRRTSPATGTSRPWSEGMAVPVAARRERRMVRPPGRSPQEARLTEGGTGSMLSATSNGKAIGPELGFGHVVGGSTGAGLLIKTAQGNRSLGFDFRPPSSGRTDPDSEWGPAEYALMLKGARDPRPPGRAGPRLPGPGLRAGRLRLVAGHKDGAHPRRSLPTSSTSCTSSRTFGGTSRRRTCPSWSPRWASGTRCPRPTSVSSTRSSRWETPSATPSSRARWPRSTRGRCGAASTSPRGPGAPLPPERRDLHAGGDASGARWSP